MQDSTQDLNNISLAVSAYVEKDVEQEKALKDLLSAIVSTWRKPEIQFYLGNKLSISGENINDNEEKKVMMVLLQDVIIELLRIYGLPTEMFFAGIDLDFNILSTKPENISKSFKSCQRFTVPVNLEFPHLINIMIRFLRGDWIDSTEEPMQRLLSEAVKFKSVTQNLSEYLDLFTPYDYANSLFCIPSSDRRLLRYASVMRRCPVSVEEGEGDSKYLKAMSIASKMLNNIKFPDAPIDLDHAEVSTALFGGDRNLTKLVALTLNRYIPELDVAIESGLGRLFLLKTFRVKPNIPLPATEEEADKILKGLISSKETPTQKPKQDTKESSVKCPQMIIKPQTSPESLSLQTKTKSKGRQSKEVKEPVKSIPSNGNVKAKEKKASKEDEKAVVAEPDTFTNVKANEKMNTTDAFKSVQKEPIPSRDVPDVKNKQDMERDVTSINSITQTETKRKVNIKKEKRKAQEIAVSPKQAVAIGAKNEIVVEETKKETEYFEIDYSPVRPSAKRKPNNKGRRSRLTKTDAKAVNESIGKSISSEPSAPIAQETHRSDSLQPSKPIVYEIEELPIEISEEDTRDCVAEERNRPFASISQPQESITEESSIILQNGSPSMFEQETLTKPDFSQIFVATELPPLKIKRRKLIENVNYGYHEYEFDFKMYYPRELPRFLPLQTGYVTGTTHVIDRYTYSHWYVLMNDLISATHVVLDFEFTGAFLKGINTSCLSELQVKVANKCSVLQTGIVLVKANGERSVWRIDASPPTKLFFTSYDFLVNTCNFCYPDYIIRRLNLNDIVVPFLHRAMGLGKLFVFHNAIYDVLHILKMVHPTAFAELLHGTVRGIEDIEAALKKHLPFLHFLDTRSIYIKHFKTWLAAAQREQGYDEIEEPIAERLEELAYTLLPEEEIVGIKFHDAAGDALVTAKLFSFFMRNGCPFGSITESKLGLLMNKVFSNKLNDQE